MIVILSELTTGHKQTEGRRDRYRDRKNDEEQKGRRIGSHRDELESSEACGSRSGGADLLQDLHVVRSAKPCSPVETYRASQLLSLTQHLT